MECLLNDECYNAHYNCNFYNPDSIPRAKRQNIVPGVTLLICYVIFELLYVPCVVVFAQKKNIRESCYKLMLFMGLISMVNIHSGCLLIGIYAIRGDVFCDRPLFNYIVGMAIFAFYTCESIVSVILALNRCIEMINHRLAVALFDGAKVYIWIGASIVYGLFMGFMFIPPIANGMMVGFFWQAHIGYVEDTEGWSMVHRIRTFFMGFFSRIIRTHNDRPEFTYSSQYKINVYRAGIDTLHIGSR
uniref:G_PROTEIN_RECEP_F1_2 domain-containing protein n=1 Tax=Globodera pallida TaxID=36090 RepID=A0A183C7K9_GLOPA